MFEHSTLPLPNRSSIKADLVILLRDRGPSRPSEIYAILADAWRLTVEERARVRSGRRLYEHEIRWARQELVIEGIMQKMHATGKGMWALKETAADTGGQAGNDALTRMIQGYLDPEKWFLSDWLPKYGETISAARHLIDANKIDEAVELIWGRQDNHVSNAGQGMIGSQELASRRGFFSAIIEDIARDSSPAAYDRIVAAATDERRAQRLSRVPRLLIARAFATIAPDHYHTTVDEERHEQVIDWFEEHTSFRGAGGNWAHKAAELNSFLSAIPELGESVLRRNLFPWFVHTQIGRNDGRPIFTAGHRLRVRETASDFPSATRSIILRHNVLVEHLYRKLVDEHGINSVGTEQPSGLGGFVDAVVRVSEKRYWIYEVKVVETASDAIRQAVGQLLEYGFREGAWNAQKIVIVAEPVLDTGSRKFLARLRKRFQLPVAYRQVTI